MTYFWVLHPKYGENQLDFQIQNLMLNLLKKRSLKKLNIQDAFWPLKIIVVAIRNHIISFRFPDTSEQLRKTKISWFKAEKLAVTWGKKFDYLKRKVFIADRKKFLTSLITSEQAYVYSTILVITRNLCVSSLFYFSFAIDNARARCLDCVNSNIYSCILSLFKLHGTIWFMN